MAIVVLEPHPPELEALLDRRRRLGLDSGDEMWEGVLHMNPGPHGRNHRMSQQLAEVLGPIARGAGLVPAMGDFNLGSERDYRVPDGGIHRPGPDEMYYVTAALVVEIVSPGDETWEKLPFYGRHEVDEVLIVEPQKRLVEWLGLEDGDYKRVDGSRLFGLTAIDVAKGIDWE
jgi:Uma2 family endonuclease